MTSYSHNDRIMGRHYLLDDDEIQRRICNGLDIFDMYPEVYSFKEMIEKFGPIQRTDSFVDIPSSLIKYWKKFSFLTKGNCIRDDYHNGYNETLSEQKQQKFNRLIE
ncbi:hypothetical protein BLA29_011953 [Euroglyphus maynei]|uniref:Uncharacterized protein n=1 Tax=Euroglyphus maynei TaxID=6958 RepID=A0A1Y3BIT4_EURMA|nr:hypothetical protein BLA29_011953 [Euroglyphus maynei]